MQLLDFVTPQFFQLVMEVPALGQEAGILSDALPDFVLHVVRAHHHGGFGMTADDGDVGREVEGFELDDIVVVLLEELAELLTKSIGDETGDVIGFVGKEVDQGIPPLDLVVDGLGVYLAVMIVLGGQLVDFEKVLIGVHRQQD